MKNLINRGILGLSRVFNDPSCYDLIRARFGGGDGPKVGG